MLHFSRILVVDRHTVCESKGDDRKSDSDVTHAERFDGSVTHDCSSHRVKGSYLIHRSRCVTLAMSTSHGLLEPFQCLTVVSIIE